MNDLIFKLKLQRGHPVQIKISYMSVAARGPNTKILQFDWFISAWIFLVLPVPYGGNLKKPC